MRVHIRWELVRALEDGSSRGIVTKIADVVEDLPFANWSIPCQFEPAGQFPGGMLLYLRLSIIPLIAIGMLHFDAGRSPTIARLSRLVHTLPPLSKLLIPHDHLNAHCSLLITTFFCIC